MQKPTVSGEFRVGKEPTLRFTPKGQAVCSTRIASTPRIKDGDDWVDGPPSWYELVAFGKLGENFAESDMYRKLITVVGTLSNEEWEDSDGNKRTSAKITAQSIGPALTWNAARVVETERSVGQQKQSRSTIEEDPYASATGQTDEPPF